MQLRMTERSGVRVSLSETDFVACINNAGNEECEIIRLVIGRMTKPLSDAAAPHRHPIHVV
jgi:hypothetical protein